MNYDLLAQLQFTVQDVTNPTPAEAVHRALAATASLSHRKHRTGAAGAGHLGCHASAGEEPLRKGRRKDARV